VLVLAEDDATLTSYGAGQDETRVGDWRTIERLEGGDGRLRYDVAADGRLEPPGRRRRVGFPVMMKMMVLLLVMVVGLQVVQMLVVRGGVMMVMVDQAIFRVFRRPFVAVGQRRRGGGRVRFAAVVPGHARDRRVPFGGRGRGRRARARFGGVHLAAADGQRLPVVFVRRRVVVGRNRRRFDRTGGYHDHFVATDFRRAYVRRRFARRPVARRLGAGYVRRRRRRHHRRRRRRQQERRGMWWWWWWRIAFAAALYGLSRRQVGRFGRSARIRRPSVRTRGQRRRPVAGRQRRRRRRVRRRFPVDGRVLHVVLEPAKVRRDGEHGGRLGHEKRQAARDERPPVPVIVIGPEPAAVFAIVAAAAAAAVVRVARTVRGRLVDDGRETVVEHRREYEQAGRQYETCERFYT